MDVEDDRTWDLSENDTVEKYKAAAAVTNDGLAFIVQSAKPGLNIWELCRAGDDRIVEGCKKLYTKLDKKGIAFPTCISVNNCAGHNSPLEGEGGVLQEGDVVKVDLGTQFDGLIAVGAHTFVCTTTPEQPITGRAADVICAAYYAGEAALRLCRPEHKASEVVAIIEEIAKVFECNVVQGVLSHQLSRFQLEGEKFIVNKPNPEEAQPEDFEFEQGEVYALDIAMSTGEGKVHQGDDRTTVFKRDPDQTYSLRLNASRQLFAEIKKKFPFGAFSLRSLEDQAKARLGIGEIQKHELVQPFPVLYEAQGELVAQFKFTVLILAGSIQKITAHPPPFVQSSHEITDYKINQVLKLGLKRKSNSAKKRKPKKKKKAAAATSAEGAMDTE
eukprot:TRINITY_DN232_c0_g1_i1.p1 TRINITY_DN232_c0_g1~~TRINITY_DN232_c0_g1_i1.p1  ORF type:complete len:410 (-),score=173.02 TRINITY_DN232_c0_g1_i1:474-1634(-)